MYTKEIFPHPKFYIAKFTKNTNPYILFIHGGPGFNCATLEYLIEKYCLFSLLDFNIILYDQRTCGRSKTVLEEVLHVDNVIDLHEIYGFFEDAGINIVATIGHSYGAKVLFDFCLKFNTTIPTIYVSTANSILVPRLNNLLLDLAYLKKTQAKKYDSLLEKMENFDIDKLWELSEELTPIFQENPERPYLYWANLKYFNIVKEIQKKVNLPANLETFRSVRKDLYSNQENYSIDLSSLISPWILINGFHDIVINGAEGLISKKNNGNIITFFKSSHYPHIEENDRFSEILNEFIKKN